MRKVIAVIFILLLLVGLAYAGDAKKEDKGVLKDDSVTVDKTKETLKEIEKGIQVRDTSADVAKYDVKTEKDKITISKTDIIKDKKVEHTKTKLVMDEKTARSIDVDKDGKFGYLRKVNGQVVEHKVVTLAELITGIDATFSDVIIDGFAGSYTKIGSSQTVSTNMSLGQSFNSTKTSAISLNISTTAYSDPYTEIAAMNPVAWYKLDATSGTTIIDSSGNGYNGIASGMTWTAGKYNNAGSFDGVNDYVTIPANNNLNVSTNGITIICLIKPSTTPSAYIRTLLNKRTIGTPGSGYLFGINKGKIYFEHRTTGDYIICTSTGLYNNSRWNIAIATVNTTSKIAKIYVDNTLVAQDAYTGTLISNTNDLIVSGKEITTSYNGLIDNIIIIPRVITANELSTICYDNLQQLQAKTNANATYSGYWNSTSNNPLTLPVSSLDGLISSVSFKVPTTVTQNGVTIYNYNQTAAPFTPSSTVYFTEDTTLISDTHTATMQTVNISHTSANTAQDGELIPYDILDEYFGTISMDSTNPNATITRNATHFMVDTGYITANTTYYYNVSIPNYVEEMVWSDWDPTNETCNAKVQIGNSTPYTTWNITTYNVTNGATYKIVYAANKTLISQARANNGQASIIITGLPDGEYWLVEIVGISSYVAPTNVIITFVPTSLIIISYMYLRRKRSGR